MDLRGDRRGARAVAVSVREAVAVAVAVTVTVVMAMVAAAAMAVAVAVEVAVATEGSPPNRLPYPSAYSRPSVSISFAIQPLTATLVGSYCWLAGRFRLLAGRKATQARLNLDVG